MNFLILGCRKAAIGWLFRASQMPDWTTQNRRSLIISLPYGPGFLLKAETTGDLEH
jgi:hypothetical protein